eukprot:825107_1
MANVPIPKRDPDPVSIDIAKNANVSGKSGRWGAIFNLMNSIIGGGIITLSEALSNSGFGLGICILLFVGLATEYTFNLTIVLGITVGKMTYEGLATRLFNKFGYYSINISIFVLSFSAMVGYLIALGRILDSFMSSGVVEVAADSIFRDRRVFIAIFSILAVLPLCLLKDLSKLEKFSGVSIFNVVVVVTLTVISAVMFISQKEGIGMIWKFEENILRSSSWPVAPNTPFKGDSEQRADLYESDVREYVKASVGGDASPKRAKREVAMAESFDEDD